MINLWVCFFLFLDRLIHLKCVLHHFNSSISDRSCLSCLHINPKLNNRESLGSYSHHFLGNFGYHGKDLRLATEEIHAWKRSSYEITWRDDERDQDNQIQLLWEVFWWKGNYFTIYFHIILLVFQWLLNSISYFEMCFCLITHKNEQVKLKR